MKLTVVAQSRVSQWKVVAAVEDRAGEQRCLVIEELDRFGEDPQTEAAVIGLEAIWDRVPMNGPVQLGTAIYHQVDEANGIYEFIKGRLRVLCFPVPGGVCVLSSVLLKRSPKTPRDEVRRAAKLKKATIAAMKTGGIEYV